MFVADDIQQRWWDLEAKLTSRFGKKPDLEAVLFLIGMQETGFIHQKISKEQKQDLMHVATVYRTGTRWFLWCRRKR